MANKVTGHVLGGQPKILDGMNTVADVKKALNVGAGYEATVQGEPSDDNEPLNDYDHVSFAPAVKGGN